MKYARQENKYTQNQSDDEQNGEEIFVAKAREARSSPVTVEKVQEVVLPWEMKYFSPMLRG